jgi:hypothetical protein
LHSVPHPVSQWRSPGSDTWQRARIERSYCRLSRSIIAILFSGATMQNIRAFRTCTATFVRVTCSQNKRRVHRNHSTAPHVLPTRRLARKQTLKLSPELLERCLERTHEPTVVPAALDILDAAKLDVSDQQPMNELETQQGDDRPSFLARLPGSPRVKGLIMLNALVFLMATNWCVEYWTSCASSFPSVHNSPAMCCCNDHQSV